MKTKTYKVPPDGGYGWFIVLAYGIFYGIIFSMGTVFGLLYKEKFEKLQLQTKEIATLASLGFSIGTMCGPIAAPLIRCFGYRKIAIVAGFLHVLGVILTAYSNSFITFLISYSVIESIGYALGIPSYLLALTTYFRKHRPRAIGLAATLMTIPPFFYPILVTKLLDLYGQHATILLVAAIALNTILSACMLQPLKLHLKNSPEGDMEAFVYNAEMAKLNNFHEEKLQSENFIVADAVVDKSNGSISKKKGIFQRVGMQIINLFDLTLLQNWSIVVIIVGMSLIDFADFTFITITPLILSDKDYTNAQIATILSVISCSDAVFRLISPFIADFLKQSSRLMYLYGVVLFIFTRIIFISTSTFPYIVINGVLTGMGRGTAFVSWNVILAETVPNERLPAMVGIEMIICGLLMVVFGPIVGYLRDLNGNYIFSILILNISSLLCFIMWTVDLFYKRKMEIEIKKIDQLSVEK